MGRKLALVVLMVLAATMVATTAFAEWGSALPPIRTQGSARIAR